MYQLKDGKIVYVENLEAAIQEFRSHFKEFVMQGHYFSKQLIASKPGMIANAKENIKRKVLTGLLANVAEGAVETGVSVVKPELAKGTSYVASGLVRVGAFVYYRMKDKKQEEVLNAAEIFQQRIEIMVAATKQQGNKKTAEITLVIEKVCDYLQERFIEALEELADSKQRQHDISLLAQFFAASLVEILLLHKIDLEKLSKEEQGELLFNYIYEHIVPPEEHALYKQLPGKVEKQFSSKIKWPVVFNEKFAYRPSKKGDVWTLQGLMLRSSCTTLDGGYLVKSHKETHADKYPSQRLEQAIAQKISYSTARPILTKLGAYSDTRGITSYLNQLSNKIDIEQIKQTIEAFIKNPTAKKLHKFESIPIRKVKMRLRVARNHFQKSIQTFNDQYTQIDNNNFKEKEVLQLFYKYTQHLLMQAYYFYLVQKLIPDYTEALFFVKEVEWVKANIEMLSAYYTNPEKGFDLYQNICELHTYLQSFSVLTLELTYRYVALNITHHEVNNFKVITETLKTYNNKTEKLLSRVEAQARADHEDDDQRYEADDVQQLMQHYFAEHKEIEVIYPISATGCLIEDKLKTYHRERLACQQQGQAVKDTVIVPIQLADKQWALCYMHYATDPTQPIQIKYLDPLGKPISRELLEVFAIAFAAEDADSNATTAVVAVKKESSVVTPLNPETLKPLALPEKYQLVPLKNDADSFFAAMALNLNTLAESPLYNAKHLRLICADYVKSISQKEHWLKKQLRNKFESYGELIAKTPQEIAFLQQNKQLSDSKALEGDAIIEGRILCEWLKNQGDEHNLYFIQLTQKKGQWSASYKRVHANGIEKLRKLDYSDGEGIYLVGMNDNLFATVDKQQWQKLNEATSNNSPLLLLDISYALPTDHYQGGAWIVECARTLALKGGLPAANFDLGKACLQQKELLHKPLDIYHRDLKSLSEKIQNSRDIQFIGALTNFKDAEKMQDVQSEIVKEFALLQQEFLSFFQEHYFAAIALNDRELLDKINTCFPRIPWDIKNNKGHSALHFAALLGSQEIFDILCKAAKNYLNSNKLDLKSVVANDDSTLLHSAAYGCNLYAIQKLLEEGLDVNVINRGQLQLNEELLAQLKEEGQDANSIEAAAQGKQSLSEKAKKKATYVNGRRTPLHLAAMTSDPNQQAVIQLLLNKGAKVDVVDDDGYTPLHFICLHGLPEIKAPLVKLLLERSNQKTKLVNAVDKHYQRTALHIALSRSRQNLPAIVKLLLEANIDVNAKNNQSDTALHLVLRTNIAELKSVVELLLSGKANINACNSAKDTPLHIAVNKLQLDIIDLLLKHQPNLSLPNQSGKTASDILDSKIKNIENDKQALRSQLDTLQSEISDCTQKMHTKLLNATSELQENISQSVGKLFMQHLTSAARSSLTYTTPAIEELLTLDNNFLANVKSEEDLIDEVKDLIEKRGKHLVQWRELKGDEQEKSTLLLRLSNLREKMRPPTIKKEKLLDKVFRF